MEWETHSAAETEELAAALATRLHDGDVLLLRGGLGAGKTAFVRGLVRGLGGDSDEVSSPTFALMNQYEGRLTVYHFDLYRLSGAEEVYDLGFDEIFSGGRGVCAVEWSEVAPELFETMRTVKVTLSGEDNVRRITLEGIDDLPDFGRILHIGLGECDDRGQADL